MAAMVARFLGKRARSTDANYPSRWKQIEKFYYAALECEPVTSDCDDGGRSRSIPTGFFGSRRPNRHRRYEAIPVGHPDLRQALRVHDVGFLNDPVHVEQIRGKRVD